MKKIKISKYLLAIIFFGVVGTFVSAKLLTLQIHSLQQEANVFAACSINSVFDCASVSESKYNELFGFPNMIMGLMYYPMIITFFGMLLFKVKPPKWMLYAMLIPVTMGLVFSLALLYISLFLIFKICVYCLGSTIAGTMIFILYNAYLIQNNETTYSLKLTHFYMKIRTSRYLLPIMTTLCIIVYAILVFFAKWYYMKYFSEEITLRSILLFPLTFFKLAWELVAH